MVLGSPSMVMGWAEIELCDAEPAYNVAEFGCLAPVRVQASADETWDTNNAAVSAVLFVPGWEEPKLLAVFGMRGVADNGHRERKMSSRKATTITAMFSVSEQDGSPSLSCVVVSTNIIQFLIIVNVQFWGGMTAHPLPALVAPHALSPLPRCRPSC